MNVKWWPALSLLLGLGLLGISVGEARPQRPRQYYGEWTWSSKGYYFCKYNYKPDAKTADYGHHYAICYPARQQHIYYFDPYRKVYWGRYDRVADGYSVLGDTARKRRLEDIPESAFPPPAGLPCIPQAKDGALMAEPPDLPLIYLGPAENTARRGNAGSAGTVSVCDGEAEWGCEEAGVDPGPCDTPSWGKERAS